MNTKLEILAHHDEMQLKDKKGHNFESYSFGVMPLLT